MGSRSCWPSGSSAPSSADLPAVPRPAGLAGLPRLRLTRSPTLGLPLAGLAAVELGAELIAAALPALGQLLDGLPDGLEPVQLPRAGAPGRGRPDRPRLPAPLRAQALDHLVEVAAEAPQFEQGLGEHALGRGQLARPRRPVGGKSLDQGPAGGQLLAPQRLLVVPRTPLALRRHRSTPRSVLARAIVLASE